jgi:23S rRNA (uracil1939-C5)-methyltransferase
MDRAETKNEAVTESARSPTGEDPPEVRIEKWVYGGRALGRLDGRAVLVPFALPGELVRFAPQRNRPGLIEADLDTILEPAPERIQAPCPYFGTCGGCQYQHAPYRYQLDQKRAVLEEVLRRVGKFALPEGTPIDVISGPEWRYRNRVQLHFSGGELGYLQGGSHDLCAIDHCPISSPAINHAIANLREMLRDRRFPRFLETLEVFTNEEFTTLNVPPSHGDTPRLARSFFEWAAERIPGAAAESLEYHAAGEIFRVNRRSFFQVNRFLIDALVGASLVGASGATAMDLYAGVGLFTIPLARQFQKVTAVESSRSAIEDLRANAAGAGVEIAAEQGNAALILERLPAAPDLLLADPPRTGLGKEVVREIVRLKPDRVVLVSCDPATGSRDIATLLAHGYWIASLILIDLFPQTFHFETIFKLERTT